MDKIIINNGDKFGLLTAVSEMPRRYFPSGQLVRIIKCQCDCGNFKEVILAHLVRWRVRSCGCLVRSMRGESATPLCKIWKAMKERCSEKGIDRNRYYDRGITVCEEWKNDFFVFKKWALENGWKKGLQIDRENNDGNYEPSNCRFVSRIINVNNRYNTLYVKYRGKKVPFTILMRKKKIKMWSYGTIRGRIERGWTVEEAFDTPIREGNYRKS